MFSGSLQKSRGITHVQEQDSFAKEEHASSPVLEESNQVGAIKSEGYKYLVHCWLEAKGIR